MGKHVTETQAKKKKSLRRAAVDPPEGATHKNTLGCRVAEADRAWHASQAANPDQVVLLVWSSPFSIMLSRIPLLIYLSLSWRVFRTEKWCGSFPYVAMCLSLLPEENRVSVDSESCLCIGNVYTVAYLGSIYAHHLPHYPTLKSNCSLGLFPPSHNISHKSVSKAQWPQ